MRRSLAVLVLALGVALGAALAPRPALGGAFAPAQSGWTVVTKSSDTARTSNTTVTADPDLTFSVAANTKYRFRMVVAFTTSDAGNFKWSILAPSSPTKFIVAYTSAFAGTTPATVRAAAYPANVVFDVGSTAGPDPNLLVIDGVAQNGANAGDLVFGWSQGTSNGASTTVHGGSYVEYKAVQ